MSSKKDYIKTAEILSMSRKNFAKDISYRNMCQDFAFEFHLDNKRFDFDKFYDACGIIRGV